MIVYATIETLNKMKYMQSSTMKILLFILLSLLSYFMSITNMMFNLIFNMKNPFKQENKLKKNKITKENF